MLISRKYKYLGFTSILAFSLFVSILSGCQNSDTNLHGSDYEKKGRVHGTIKISGSVTMNNLISLWCRGFSNIYPDVTCIVESYGSHTAPEELTNSSVDLGMMSDPMTDKEINNFRSVNGYEPYGLRVALDMIGVFVSRDNPLECISIADLDGIYSMDKLCPGATDIDTWGELGLDGRWQDAKIITYGRNTESGTYDAFRKIALCSGEYRESVKRIGNSEDIIDFVSGESQSIGYSGIGYLTSNVKALSIGEAEEGCYPPESQYAESGKYPLSRYLYLYARKHKSEDRYILVREFLNFILSKDGQKYIKEAGHDPLPVSIYEEELEKFQSFDQ